VGAAFLGVNVVGKRMEEIGIPRIVLDCHLNAGLVSLSLKVDDLAVQGILILVQELNKGQEATFIVVPLFLSLCISEYNQESFV